jgi:hypothetical protein
MHLLVLQRSNTMVIFATAGWLRRCSSFIRGRSNKTGSGNEYDPNEMVSDTDIIVGTINYRLGVFGFLDGRRRCVGSAPTS